MADSPVTPPELKALISDPTSSLCGNFINTLLKLPAKIYEIFNAWLDSDGNFTEAFKKSIANATIRTGDLIFSLRALDEDGRLLCDGRAVSRATYADLFTQLGTFYGPGDTTTTFNLPDFRDRFPKGKNAETVGTSGGNANNEVTLDVTNLPPHKHRIACPNAGDLTIAEMTGVLLGNNSYASADTSVNAAETQAAGGSGNPAAAVPLNVQNLYISCFVYTKT